jgi:uroporphyrin-III C-methyltransferase
MKGLLMKVPNESKDVLDKAPTVPEPEEKPEQPRRSKRGVATFIGTLAFLIALLSFVPQFFLWQLLQRGKQGVQQVQTSLGEVQSNVNQNQATLAHLQAQLQQQEKSSTKFLAQEAEYLITLSSYHLNFMNNVDLAIKLLESADQKLGQINDPALGEVRKSLVKDLSALKTIPKVDIAGLSLRLTAISEQLDSLAALPVTIPQTISSSPTAPTEKGGSWKDRLFATLHQLQSLVTIKHVESSKFLLPEQQFYLLENIKLQLIRAQWALLHQNNALYQQSLDQARHSLQSYFSKNPKAANIIQSITALQTTNVKPNFPDLAKTRQLMQAYINSANKNETMEQNATSKSTTL